MLATLLSEKEITPLLGDDLDIGVIGAPNSCMISGSLDAITGLEKKLAEMEMVSSRMRVSYAFHSGEMAPIEEDFIKFMKTVTFNAPRIPYISNLTGAWITDEEAVSPHYWFNHIRGTVRFDHSPDSRHRIPS